MIYPENGKDHAFCNLFGRMPCIRVYVLAALFRFRAGVARYGNDELHCRTANHIELQNVLFG